MAESEDEALNLIQSKPEGYFKMNFGKNWVLIAGNVRGLLKS